LLLAVHAPIPSAPRAAEADIETRKLMQAVQTLAADRERLVVRIGAIERNLEDITGSIRRRGAGSSAAGGVASPASAPALAPPGATTEAVSPKAVEPAASEAAAPPVADSATTTLPPASERVATAAAPSEAAPEPPKAEFGVDVGGAVNMEGMRVLWASTRGHNAAPFEGMHPLVATRENARTKRTGLRLIVGPIVDVEAAARLCGKLAAARRYCQPVGFEGERLVEAEPAADRKPAAAPRPPPRATPQPPARAQRPFP
jgi:hypothetical protein